jgi:hypothetical protein
MASAPAPADRPATTTAGPARRPAWEPAARAAVVGLAFLLALTTARNADLWAHLASGRAAVSVHLSAAAGLLPFSWLADAVMYLAFFLLGGPGLVLGKAVVVALAAAVMVEARVSGRGVLTATLAVLALGPWLPLNPVCASYLFLACTVALIDRTPDARAAGWGQRLGTHWPVLLDFAVWANTDVWCVVGLAVVAAHAVGRTVARAVRRERFEPGPWLLLALVCAAVALSPLPWNVAAAVHELRGQLTNADPGLSPFRADLLSAARAGRFEGLVPVAAFWLLAGVGLWSFAAAGRGRAGEWLLPWAGLLAAAALDVRLAPFFVVLCGVVAVRNFRRVPGATVEASAPVPARPRATRLRVAVGASLAALGAVVLFAAAWAGWLQPVPSERRNWTVEADPSLAHAADEVAGWYASGTLAADRRTVFFAREAEDTFAWFAPQVPAAGGEYRRGGDGVARVRAAVLTSDGSRVGDGLVREGVGCVVLSDTTRAGFTAALHALDAARGTWKLASLRGRVAVFVRTDTGLPAVDLAARAFGPAADRAAEGGEPQLAPRPHWSDPFVVPRPPRSIDRDEAVTYLLHEEATRDRRMVAGANRFLALLGASVAAAPPPVPAAWPLDPRPTILAVAAGNVRPPSEGPPPVPFGRFAAFLVLTEVSADHSLAVRAGRRGVAASPRDAGAFAALGEAYLHLLSDPLEGSWGVAVPGVRRLRFVQAAAAFRQALALDPGHAAAHLGLANVFLQQGFLDLAADEFRAYERYAGKEGLPAEAAADLSRAVAERRRATEANAANLSVLDRARLAARNNLPGLALDTLLRSDVAGFGPAGTALEFDLLLAAGRLRDAREWLTPEHRAAIGPQAYDWLKVQAAAAAGDYSEAADTLRAQAAGPPRGPETPLTAKQVWDVAAVVGDELFFKNRQALPQLPLALLAAVSRVGASGRQLIGEYQSRTEAHVLLALLALERGDMPACAGHLEDVRKLWEDVDREGTRFPTPVRTVAGQMASLIRR